jgi:hypothetical protein
VDQLIECIRVAVANDATAETRAAGAAACRTILTALDAKLGEPLAAPAVPTPNAQAVAIASALRSVPMDQLADLLIAKLRTMVPPDAQPAVRRINIPLARIPTP